MSVARQALACAQSLPFETTGQRPLWVQRAALHPLRKGPEAIHRRLAGSPGRGSASRPSGQRRALEPLRVHTCRPSRKPPPRTRREADASEGWQVSRAFRRVAAGYPTRSSPASYAHTPAYGLSGPPPYRRVGGVFAPTTQNGESGHAVTNCESVSCPRRVTSLSGRVTSRHPRARQDAKGARGARPAHPCFLGSTSARASGSSPAIEMA